LGRREINDDSDKIILTLSYMKGGTAGPWADQKIQQYTNREEMPCWEEFIGEFNSVFGDPDPAGTARYKMDKLSQGSMLADDYIAKFRELQHDTGYNDAALVEHFKKGLNTALVDKVFTLQEMPTTLKGWEQWASKFDRQWRQRQAEKKTLTGPPNQKVTTPTHSPKPFSTNPTTYERREPVVVPMEVDTGRKNRPRLICYKCRKPGHMARDCQSSVDIGALDYEGLKAHFEQNEEKSKKDFQ
jgi:Retrotransposon gag protein/Zinc knuckle